MHAGSRHAKIAPPAGAEDVDAWDFPLSFDKGSWPRSKVIVARSVRGQFESIEGQATTTAEARRCETMQNNTR